MNDFIYLWDPYLEWIKNKLKYYWKFWVRPIILGIDPNSLYSYNSVWIPNPTGLNTRVRLGRFFLFEWVALQNQTFYARYNATNYYLNVTWAPTLADYGPLIFSVYVILTILIEWLVVWAFIPKTITEEQAGKIIVGVFFANLLSGLCGFLIFLLLGAW